ncbi:TPA: hypothetical protein KDY59_003639 [Vibrio parahaemolyticus]|nr:hypothetical protein [Vibrio parahaemolyticus]
MKRHNYIDFKEQSTEAAAFVAFTSYLQRDTHIAAKVSIARMIKTICRSNLVDHKKIDKSEYPYFIDWVERFGLYVNQLYKEIIAIREIPVSLHQPEERFIAQAERIFSAVLDHIGRENVNDSIGDLDLALAKLHYAVLKKADNESLAAILQPD